MRIKLEELYCLIPAHYKAALVDICKTYADKEWLENALESYSKCVLRAKKRSDIPHPADYFDTWCSQDLMACAEPDEVLHVSMVCKKQQGEDCPCEKPYTCEDPCAVNDCEYPKCFEENCTEIGWDSANDQPDFDGGVKE